MIWWLITRLEIAPSLIFHLLSDNKIIFCDLTELDQLSEAHHRKWGDSDHLPNEMADPFDVDLTQLILREFCLMDIGIELLGEL